MSYVTPHLYLGDAIKAQDFEFLKKKNVKLIVNCARELPNYFQNNFAYIRLDWDDTLNQSITKQLNKIADAIALSIKRGHVVYVHCAAGISRSATVVIYSLMKLHNWDYNRAYLFVKDFRPIIQPNSNFVEQIMRISTDNSTSLEYENFKLIKDTSMYYDDNDTIDGDITNMLKNDIPPKVVEPQLELYNSEMLHPTTLNLKPKGTKYIKMDKQSDNVADGKTHWSKLTFDCKDCESPSFVSSGRGIYAKIFS
jgi:hypothetical protein